MPKTFAPTFYLLRFNLKRHFLYRLSVRVFWIVSRIRNGCNMLRAYNYGPIYKYTTTAFFPNYRYIVYIWNIFITFYLPLFQTKWISIQLFEPLSSHKKSITACAMSILDLYMLQDVNVSYIQTLKQIVLFNISIIVEPKRLPWYA